MTTTETPTPEQQAAAVKAATTREAVLKALLDQVKEAYEEARTEVQDALDKQQRATGGTKFDATLPDGTKVGSVSLTGGEPAAQVTDPNVYAQWVRATYPSEVTPRIVFEVQGAFTAKLLGEMTAAGVTQYADPETGELHDVPGVEIKATRSRSHSMTFLRKSKAVPDGGRGLVGDAWRRGELAPIVLPALAPGGDS